MATIAPHMAPAVVAISKNIPSRILVMPSFTKAAADPEEVAITETSEAPIAYLISTWSRRVSSGIMIKPPPSPVREPSKPAP